jgi:hypothetical protein
MLYKYINGRAQLKSVLDLPPPATCINEGDIRLPLHITIPQPDGPAVGRVTHDVSTASKMLGVHFSPAGNSATHVKHIVQKGLDWADCLQTKPLPCHDAWLSFNLQLFLAISWGLITVCLTPHVLDMMIQCIYAKALPSLGANRKIKKQWRTLPEMYQDLSLPNFPLIALAEKVSFLLHNWGFKRIAHSDALAMTYDNFLLKARP